MKYHTNEGKTYCVVGTVAGTVTSASGVIIASFSANEQNYFTAPTGGFVTISDENAIVTPVFKLAPSALVGKSGGGASGGENTGGGASGGENTQVWTFANDGTYTVEGDMPIWTDGNNKFSNDTKIISWKGNLPNMTMATAMFNYCTNLTSFEGDLPNLTNGSNMFRNCENLRSFEGDLSNLTKGYQMFYCCTNLTEWNAPLPNLTDGKYMFGGQSSSCTKLDLVSVQNIANTINDLTAAGTTGTIHIGMQTAIQGNADLETALAAIRAKGWTVTEIYA